MADTAFSIAVVRAEEAERPPAERLFDDPLAPVFAAAGAHVRESTERFLALPFFRDGVRLRTRFIDDTVRAGLAAGLRQLVLLGAGFDARGHRLVGARSGVTVYELDTHEQLARKRALIARAGVRAPRRIRYVPVAFERADLERDAEPALVRRGFDPGRGAVFVWEGVIGYIDLDAVRKSLRFMAHAGGPGSLLVFTFHDSVFEPERVDQVVRRAGWDTFEERNGEALWREHLAGEPGPAEAFLKIGVARRNG